MPRQQRGSLGIMKRKSQPFVPALFLLPTSLFKAISELAASIAAHGLLQSLVALKDALPLLPPFGTELKELRPTICVRIARLLGRGIRWMIEGAPIVSLVPTHSNRNA